MGPPLRRAFVRLPHSPRIFLRNRRNFCAQTAHPGRKGTRLSSSRHDYRSLVGRDSYRARLGTSLAGRFCIGTCVCTHDLLMGLQIGMAAHPLFRRGCRIYCRVIACFGYRRDSRVSPSRPPAAPSSIWKEEFMTMRRHPSAVYGARHLDLGSTSAPVQLTYAILIFASPYASHSSSRFSRQRARLPHPPT